MYVRSWIEGTLSAVALKRNGIPFSRVSSNTIHSVIATMTHSTGTAFQFQELIVLTYTNKDIFLSRCVHPCRFDICERNRLILVKK